MSSVRRGARNRKPSRKVRSSPVKAAALLDGGEIRELCDGRGARAVSLGNKGNHQSKSSGLGNKVHTPKTVKNAKNVIMAKTALTPSDVKDSMVSGVESDSDDSDSEQAKGAKAKPFGLEACETEDDEAEEQAVAKTDTPSDKRRVYAVTESQRRGPLYIHLFVLSSSSKSASAPAPAKKNTVVKT